jgi:protein phosphatase
MIKDDGIAAALAESADLDDAVAELISEANEAGGRDNITAVAVRVEDAEAVEAADEGATLIGPSAEEAGLSAERVAAARARQARDREPVASPRRARWKTAAKVLVVVAVIAGIGVAAVLGARQIYFLGIDEGGRVTLYRGLPYDLPLGVELYSEVESIPVQASSVPVDRRDSLTDHDLRSHDDAVDLLDDLESVAVAPKPQPEPEPKPKPPGDGKGERQGQGGKSN